MPKFTYFTQFFWSCLFLLAPIFLVLGEMELFQFFLSKAFIAAGSRTISSLLIKMGFSGGLALAVVWSMKFFFIEESCNMMAPRGNSGDGDGSGGLIYLEAVPLKPVSTNRPRTLPTLVNPQRLLLMLRFIIRYRRTYRGVGSSVIAWA